MRKKELIAFGLALTVALCPTVSTTAFASEKASYIKDENVYGSLESDGTVKEVYLVNQFNIKKGGKITDYGKYDTVTNLTNTETIEEKNGCQVISASKGELYYQGDIKGAELPWNIAIRYMVDGKEVPANKLAGATIANAGTSRQLSYTVMPKKNADITLKADIKDFEMPGISIAGIPFSMSVDLPDTGEMSSGLTDLAGGIQKLNDGVGDLDDGATEFSNGMSSYTTGVSKVDTSFSKLVKAATDLKQGSKSIDSGLGKLKKNGKSVTSGISQLSGAASGFKAAVGQMDLSGLSARDAAYIQQMAAALDTGLSSLNTGISKYVAGVGKLAGGYSDFDSGISKYASGIKSMGKGISKLGANGEKISEGAVKLSDGISKLHGGTQEMADETADMPEEMDKEINHMTSEYTCEFDMTSYASDQNKKINAVQFTLSTEEIKIPEAKVKEKKEEEKGFIERLKELF